jgi:hypothetical protein
MNKKSAIRILEIQKQKLDDVNLYKDETWVFQTASYIKDFFGENSTEYVFISQFTFGVVVPTTTPPDEMQRLFKYKIEKVSKFLDNCIETIRIKGTLKTEKLNFLNRLNNGILIGLILPIFSGLIGIGFYFGTEKINKDNVELTTQNSRIKSTYDSLQKVIDNKSRLIIDLTSKNDSIDKMLYDAKSLIQDYNKTHFNITISYSQPYSLFEGQVLINTEKKYNSVLFSFEGIKNVNDRLEFPYEKKAIEMEQGKRFYLLDNFNQIWIVNVMKIGNSDLKLELIKKDIP